MIFQNANQIVNSADSIASPRSPCPELLRLFILSCGALLLTACFDADKPSTSDSNSRDSSRLPTVSLSATPDRVTRGTEVTLAWTTTDASSCAASGAWSGTKPLNGTVLSPVTSDGTYTLTCTGSGGSADASATVVVETPPPAAPLISLSVNSNNVPYSGSATFSWSSSNATTCAASNAWSGSKDIAGTQTLGALINTGTYTLTCAGAGGSATQSVTVTVEVATMPTVTLTSSATTIAYNGSATLTWSTANATSCTASGAWSGTKATSGTQTLAALTASGTYKLTCSGTGGSNSQSVALTVQAPPVPVVTLTANPASVAYNGTSILNWSSTNATACSASGAWSGPQLTAGTLTLASLTTSSAYTLTCTGTGGSTGKSVTIAVTASPEKKIDIPDSSVSASTYDTRCACGPASAVDSDVTTRWSGSGDGAYITFDLGAPHTVEYLKIAWHRGNERTALFDVLAADTTTGPWTTLLTGKTSGGISTDLERVDFTDTNAQYLRIVGHGNSAGDGWNSILEVQVFGTAIARAAAPVFSPAGDVYPNGTTVTMTTTTSGAEIRYTMDGSTPTSTNGIVYSAPLPIVATATLKAVAIKNGIADSASASATYTVASSGGGGGNLDSTLPPSGNFELSQWKLTIPNGADVSVATVNSGYTLADAFYTDPLTGGMVFRTPNIAGTTSGSTYSRSELREMLNESAGTTNLGNNWVLSTSSASAKAAAASVDGTMQVTLSVDHVSTTGDSAKVGRVVVGQIHGPDTEVIRLYYHKRPTDMKGAIYFGHDTPSSSNTYHAVIGDPATLDPVDGIALGERWSYEIKVVGQTLIVSVTPKGRATFTKSIPIETGYNDQYLYYKVGVYNQNNTGDTTDYARATVYSLSNIHP